MANIDMDTVAGFEDEWTAFDQSRLSDDEAAAQFHLYFQNFPWHALRADATGFDLGCGTGRWAKQVAPRVGTLHCIDASAGVIEIARRNLKTMANCVFHVASVDSIPKQRHRLISPNRGPQVADYGVGAAAEQLWSATAAGCPRE